MVGERVLAFGELYVSEKKVEKDRNFVTALARGLEILRCFGPKDEYLGNAELASRTNIPRPTVSRMTATLTQLGYLNYSDNLEKYRLGSGVLELGYRYLASESVRAVARPYMQELADATDCMVAIGTVEGTTVTYIQVCHGDGPLVLRLSVGSQVPLATSALGRAYLAALPVAQRQPYLQRIKKEDPKAWPQVEAGLQEAFADYEKHGFCLAEGEWNDDVSGVAVPLYLEGGSRILPMNCGGSALRLNRKVLVGNLGPRLLAVAETVQTLMQESFA